MADGDFVICKKLIFVKVNATVHITWVQPRVLNKDQVKVSSHLFIS